MGGYVLCFLVVLEECDLYSFGFSMLRPMGARHLRRCVQWFSLEARMVIACGLLGGFLMNSNTVIVISLVPYLWFGVLKCLPTLLSKLLVSMSRK